MTVLRRLVAVLALLPALALPAGAAAGIAPPGNSGIDQYRETVPDAGGNRTPAPGPATSARERRRLERLGPDGRALADAIDRTAPAAAPDPEPRRGDGAATADPDQRAALPDPAGDSPVASATGTSLGDDDGLGLLLPALLGATVIAAVLLVLVRRRASS